jgi:hypothetical protein
MIFGLSRRTNSVIEVSEVVSDTMDPASMICTHFPRSGGSQPKRSTLRGYKSKYCSRTRHESISVSPLTRWLGLQRSGRLGPGVIPRFDRRMHPDQGSWPVPITYRDVQSQKILNLNWSPDREGRGSLAGTNRGKRKGATFPRHNPMEPSQRVQPSWGGQ